MSRTVRELYRDIVLEPLLPQGFWGLEKFYHEGNKMWVVIATHECGTLVEAHITHRAMATVPRGVDPFAVVVRGLRCHHCEPVDAEFHDQDRLGAGQLCLPPPSDDQNEVA